MASNSALHLSISARFVPKLVDSGERLLIPAPILPMPGLASIEFDFVQVLPNSVDAGGLVRPGILQTWTNFGRTWSPFGHFSAGLGQICPETSDE